MVRSGSSTNWASIQTWSAPVRRGPGEGLSSSPLPSVVVFLHHPKCSAKSGRNASGLLPGCSDLHYPLELPSRPASGLLSSPNQNSCGRREASKAPTDDDVQRCPGAVSSDPGISLRDNERYKYWDALGCSPSHPAETSSTSTTHTHNSRTSSYSLLFSNKMMSLIRSRAPVRYTSLREARAIFTHQSAQSLLLFGTIQTVMWSWVYTRYQQPRFAYPWIIPSLRSNVPAIA